MKLALPALALSALVLLPGCRPTPDKGAPAPLLTAPPMADPHGMGMKSKTETKVVIPDALKGKYKAIKIVVVDVPTKKETPYVVALGVAFPLPGTGMTVQVDNVLPHFGMGEGVITSSSDKMTNPAAQVRVSEGGKEVWKGWLFSLYPDTHAFANDKYTLKLVDFVAAK
jgi:hypothetical protein